MKRYRASDEPRKKPKARTRELRYQPRPARPIERIRAPSAPDLEEADDFLQYHFARIKDAKARQRAAVRAFEQAKEAERQAFGLIAAHLAACGEPQADTRRRGLESRQKDIRQ